MRSRKNNGRHQGSPKKNKRSTKTQGSPKKNQREMSIGELTTKIQHIKLSKNRLLKKKQTLQADGTGKRKLEEYNIPDLPPAKIMKLSESPSYIDSEDKQIVYDFLDAMMKGFEEPVKLFINSVMFMGFIKEYDTHLFEVSTNRLLMKNIEWINKYPTNDEKVKLMLIFNGVNQIMDYFIDSLKDSKSLISPADTLKIQLNQYFSDRMKDLFRLVRMTISFYNLLEEVRYTALIEDTLALYALQKHHNSRYIYDVIQDYDPDDDYISVDDSLGKILKVINSADLEYTPMEDELLTFEESTFRSQRFLKRDKEPHDTLLMSLLRSNLYNGRNDFLIKCSILLINHKANVNAVNKETGETPLMIVCQAFSGMETELIELLLSNGADVNAVNKLGNGKTPLLYALSNSLYKHNFDTIDTLLSNGAKADVVDALGYNTLTISLLPLKVSRLLMDIKPDEKYPGRLPADINAKNNRNGETPLMHAVFNNDEDFINELLTRGANKNVTNNEGDTAYLIACRLSRYPDVVKQLYLPNKQINNKGQTPLMLICDNIIMNYNEKVDLIKYLLVKGAC